MTPESPRPSAACTEGGSAPGEAAAFGMPVAEPARPSTLPATASPPAAAAPTVSVVIASHGAASVLPECLAALGAAAGSRAIEIIVAHSSADRPPEDLQHRFPGIRWLDGGGRPTIPQLRGAGIAASHGAIIAVVDPYCLVDGHWLEELIRIHGTRPEPAVGGAVVMDAAEANLASWAMYFSEYAAFTPPLDEGPSVELTGNNISYKRRALGDVAAMERAGFWKAFFNRRLQADGHQLWTAPSIVVRLRKPVPFREFLRSRYHHGRCFAAMRVAGTPWYVKGWRAGTAPIVPLVALGRQARHLWPKGQYRTKFLLCLPLLLLLHGTWAVGEWWGYTRGSGRSCDELTF